MEGLTLAKVSIRVILKTAKLLLIGCAKKQRKGRLRYSLIILVWKQQPRRGIDTHPNHLDNFKRYNRVSPTRFDDSRIINMSEVTRTEFLGG